MADNVADLTLAHVRKIDQTLSRVWEVLERHETRMSRVERDVLELKRDIGELKSDQILMENRLLNRMDEILKLTTRVEGHNRRLDTLEAQLET
jgi:hypothetical protein